MTNGLNFLLSKCLLISRPASVGDSVSQYCSLDEKSMCMSLGGKQTGPQFMLAYFMLGSCLVCLKFVL